MLCKLIKDTDAQIILHSGWKYWFDDDLKPLRKEAENLRALLEREGLTIAGVTPDHTTDEIRKSKKFSLVKAGEILEWLAQHKDVDKWVVLDDLDLHNKEIERHQVRTDQSIGLTDENVENAKGMLKENMYATQQGRGRKNLNGVGFKPMFEERMGKDLYEEVGKGRVEC